MRAFLSFVLGLIGLFVLVVVGVIAVLAVGTALGAVDVSLPGCDLVAWNRSMLRFESRLILAQSTSRGNLPVVLVPLQDAMLDLMMNDAIKDCGNLYTYSVGYATRGIHWLTDFMAEEDDEQVSAAFDAMMSQRALIPGEYVLQGGAWDDYQNLINAVIGSEG